LVVQKNGITITRLFDGGVYLNDGGFWCRVCLTCKKAIQHSRKDGAIDSFKKKRLCGSCAKSGKKNWNYKNGDSFSSKKYKKPIKDLKFRIETPSTVYFNEEKCLWCRKCPCCHQETEYTCRWWCIKAEKKKSICSKCSFDRYISSIETDFLNYMLVKERQQNINEFIVDGIDYHTNTIYEFLGDYWHGNPALYCQTNINKCNKKTFGQLYQETLNRFGHLKDLGYSIYYVWEHDWNRFRSGVDLIPKILCY